tara:strand:+ start:172 stop:294 length:123 start_codon:yes stop_codon:yes gene_type:complete
MLSDASKHLGKFTGSKNINNFKNEMLFLKMKEFEKKNCTY